MTLKIETQINDQTIPLDNNPTIEHPRNETHNYQYKLKKIKPPTPKKEHRKKGGRYNMITTPYSRHKKKLK